MKKTFTLFALVCLFSVNAYGQKLASYGLLNSSLSTSSAGVVTGTPFALPSGYANMITWTVVADGSGLSVNLEGSNDNVSWFTMDSQTTATGGLKNFGFTSVKFTRCSQVSRTGGTTTTCTFVVSRGYITSGSVGNLTRILVGNGTAAAPSYSFTTEPTTGFMKPGAGAVDMISAGTQVVRFSSSGIALLTNAAGSLTLGSSADTVLARTAAGKISLTGTTPMFQLGGTTSSFPAIKQSGALIQFRLADDSGFAQLTASTVNLSASLSGTSPLIFVAAPTISSGFGTSPSVASNNGTAAFTINVGTGGTANTGVIGLPTATNGWNCYATDITTNNATAFITKQTATTTTTATISNFTTAGVLGAWAASDILQVSCFAR